MPWIYTPEIVYQMEGRRIIARLQAEGMELDLDQVNVAELGRASLGPSPRWVDQEPTLAPEAREILARIANDRARRPSTRLPLDQDQVQGRGGTPPSSSSRTRT